jgi:hypothetical protein
MGVDEFSADGKADWRDIERAIRWIKAHCATEEGK